MTRLIIRLLILSAPGVLLLPGNEVHRDRVVQSLTAAYSNAGDYCLRNQATCETVAAHARNAGLALAREVAAAADTVARAERSPSSPDQYRASAAQLGGYSNRNSNH